MVKKYPLPGDVYESRLFPGEKCRVLTVLEAQVTFKWIDRYQHLSQQTAPVIQFIRDFEPDPTRDSPVIE